MQVTAEVVAAIAVPIVSGFIGALAWLFRLESRVQRHDEQIDDFKDDLRYIRSRIDAAIDRD